MNEKAILLVDDDAQILRSLQRELDELLQELGLRARTFQDPLKALEFIKSGSEDIAILLSDQKMPEMCGADLIGETAAVNEDIVSLLLTAYSDIDAVIASIRSGISAFLLKPWKEDELAGEVRKAYGTHCLRRERKEKDSLLKEELKLSGQLQRKFLMPQIPGNDRLRITSSYVPLMPCGGDFYDFIPIDRDNYLFLIGDVAGHGVNAAFITFIIKTLTGDPAFRSQLHRNLSVPSLLSWLNIRLMRELANIQPIIISLCIAHFDLNEKKMKVCNGGHMPPMLMRGEKTTSLDARGTALGFSENIKYIEKSYSLQSGDRIVFYTDGVSEIENRGKSLSAIMSFYRNNRYFASAVMEEIRTELSSEPFADDMTLISIEVMP